MFFQYRMMKSQLMDLNKIRGENKLKRADIATGPLFWVLIKITINVISRYRG